MTADGVVLDVQGLVVRYGPIEAVHGIDLQVRQGEIVALIGANGAGKSSSLLAISGVQRLSAGTVTFLGDPIQKLPGHRIAAMGLGHVPEGRRIFGRMTVWENIAMGSYAQRRLPPKEEWDRIFDLFPVLRQRQKQLAGTLSGGEQQMLALARALVSRPKLLLMDEPSMGLAPIVVQMIFGLLQDINHGGQGTTVLLVEQNARMALRIANRAYVIEAGSIRLNGDAADLARDESVRSAYLGGERSTTRKRARPLPAEGVASAIRSEN